MRSKNRWHVGLAVFLGLTGPVAADTVDTPQYKEWARWREGASITFKSEAVANGQVQVVSTSTQTLKKLTEEKAVIEVTGVTEAGGQTIKAEPVTFEIPARVPRVDVKSEEPSEVKDAPKVKETKGQETLTISGKQLDCEWIQYEVAGMGTTKIWSCKDVPLGQVKSVSNALGNSNTIQLIEWTATRR